MSNVLQQSVVVNATDPSSDPVVDTKTETLDALSRDYLDTKSKLDQLSEELKVKRQRLVGLIGLKDQGQTSKKTDKFKITTTGSLNRKITDLETLKALAPELLVTKETLDAKAFKDLAVSNPMLYQKVLRCIETSQRTPAIKIEALKEA